MLTDTQLRTVMKACQPLDPSKRATLMERVAGQLRRLGTRHPTDADVERAIPITMSGLQQGSAA